MKTISPYTKSIAFLLFLFVSCNASLLSQGTDSRRPSPASRASKVCLTIWVNPSKTQVSSGEITGITTLEEITGNSLNGALNLDLFFSGVAGITLGIGYNAFSSQFSLGSWTDNYSTKDSETESYIMTIVGNSIIENNKIGYIHIPLGLTFRFPVESKVGFNLHGGIGFNIPVVKSYDGSGTFSYSGYYAIYNVTLSGIPVYFPSNVATTGTGDLELKSFSLSANASGSISIAMGKSIHLLIGGHYTMSLSNILESGPDPNYMVSSKSDEFNSLMEGSSAAGVKAFGLNIGLRFALK